MKHGGAKNTTNFAKDYDFRSIRSPGANHVSIDEIKSKFNETASLLRNTDDRRSPRAWREKTTAYGLPSLELPTEYGGQGWPASKMIEIFRHAGRYNLNFRDVVGGGHVRPLLKSKNPELTEIVKKVATGQAYMAIAITEPEAGSDVPSIRSTAKKVEGGYLLSGEKRFNARLKQATHVILFTQSASQPLGKLSAFVAPIPTAGLKIQYLSAHELIGNSHQGQRVLGAKWDGAAVLSAIISCFPFRRARRSIWRT